MARRLARCARISSDSSRAITEAHRHSLKRAWLSIGNSLYREGIADCVAGLAGVAAVDGPPARAAPLFGATVAIRATTSPYSHAANRAEWERHVAVLRAWLGEHSFSSACAEGRAIALGQATACALNESD